MTAVFVGDEANAAPRSLDVASLDATTAGTQSNPLARGAAVIVADRSEISMHTRREISLEARSQENAAALNVVNAADADVANTLNVASNIGMRVLGRQLNDIFQAEHRHGRFERISLSGPNLNRSYREQWSRSAGSMERSSDMTILQSRSRNSVSDTWSTQVPAYLPLQQTRLDFELPDLGSVTAGEFRRDYTATTPAGTYGFRGGFGPFEFSAPRMSLGSVELDGDDVVLRGGYVELPSLDLGTASLTVCVVACTPDISVDLPTFGGQRIDFGSAGEWRLEGANPFKDIRINAGHGVAAAGRGRVSVGAAHVELQADITLDLPDISTDFSFDVLGETVTTDSFDIVIPAISTSITLVDEDIGVAYEAEFDGALCLSVQSTDCGTLSHSESAHSEIVDIRQSNASAVTTLSEEHDSTGEQHLTSAATLDGAEAELIAMSEGNAQIEVSSTVDLGAQSQRNLAAINAINAAGALVGNALNVTTHSTATSAGAGLAQSNSFAQFKTPPRAP